MYPAETEALECFFNNASTHTSQQTQKLRNTDDDGKMQHSLKASGEEAEETSVGSDQQQKKSRRDVQEREQGLALVHILQVKTGAVCAIDDVKGGLCWEIRENFIEK